MSFLGLAWENSGRRSVRRPVADTPVTGRLAERELTRRVGAPADELPWHLMHITSYAEAVRDLQPIIQPLFASIESGLRSAREDHAQRSFLRRDEPWFYLYAVRRLACQELRDQGLQATIDGSRFRFPMSSIIVTYRGYVVRVLHSDSGPTTVPPVPVPGRSRSRQAFWRQEPFDGMRTENLLLIWRDDQGELIDPMLLVRPLGGDHREASLVVHWQGPLFRSMSNLRAADLDELVPDHEYKTLEADGA